MTRSESLPTYADIAAKAGVSTKTVCNVFRNPEIVREKTGDKVMKALDELGVKDLAVMRARLRPARPVQGKSLLFLESGIPSGALSSPVYARIIHAAEARAHEQGWQFSLRHKKSGDSLREALRNFRGDGVILFGSETTAAEVLMASPGISVVRLMACPDEGPDCDHIDYDRHAVPHLAARHLHKLGCRKVACLGEFDSRGDEFMAAAAALGLQTVDGRATDLFQLNGNTQVINRLALQRAWGEAASARPDGVFVQSDQITNSLYALLKEAGLRPQQDIQIVSCNADELFLSPLHPRPATIDIHTSEIGRRGVDLLITRMHNQGGPFSSVIIRPNLIPGEPRE